ncbi:hypothetical protein QFC20_007855 [Naganishia adeliensis]|uniref:Uncharacterized protein n=1 Tax=Naganishia adeliensis TaxID=92952 RepID=A0ACC2UWD4_9TREE|nr:hypothetical protein QFC20_007855 [Naganishia adeliensis]
MSDITVTSRQAKEAEARPLQALQEIGKQVRFSSSCSDRSRTNLVPIQLGILQDRDATALEECASKIRRMAEQQQQLDIQQGHLTDLKRGYDQRRKRQSEDVDTLGKDLDHMRAERDSHKGQSEMR